MYEYDALGRLWKLKVNKLHGQSLTIDRVTTYEYDAAGNLKSTVSDQGTPATGDDVTQANEYDKLDRLTKLADKIGPRVVFDQTSFTYTSDGQKTGLLERRYDSQTGWETAKTRMTWGYDGNGRLKLEKRDEGDNNVAIRRS